MHQQERIKAITEILKKNGYVSVKYLTDELHYSNATINRDLNIMKKQKLVKRSYGGVELLKTKAIPLVFRYHKMRPQKNIIGKAAAEFIEDGDTIFIDGTTTTQCIGKYITEKKDLIVITNNIGLAAFLSEYNINVICLGGKVVEIPDMVYSDITVQNASRFHADKMFFSVGSVNENGKIGTSGIYELMHIAMMENSDKVFLLVDHDKINRPMKQYLTDFNNVDYVISDFNFSDDTKNKYKNTEFINTSECQPLQNYE